MHSLRKGFGCRYAAKVPAQVLQKLMRHSNIKTTMDYYANVDDAVEQAVLGQTDDPPIFKNKTRGIPHPHAPIPSAPDSRAAEGEGQAFQNQTAPRTQRTAQNASGAPEATDTLPRPSGAVLDAQDRSGPERLNKRTGVTGSRIAANRTEGGAKASAVAEAVNGLPNAAQDPGAAFLEEGRPCGSQSARRTTRRHSTPPATGHCNDLRNTPPAAAPGQGAENDVTTTQERTNLTSGN
jgi:hypothetical protein